MANKGLSMRKVREVLRLHHVAGLSGRAMPGETRFAMPDWSQVHRELRRKGVTLALLWHEYKEAHPEGMQYIYGRLS